jgi:hypothetical protein
MGFIELNKEFFKLVVFMLVGFMATALGSILGRV